MILSELKSYIEEHGSVSQTELAKKFALSGDGVDAMLTVWIKKGLVSRLVDTNKADKVTRIRYALVKQDALSLTVTM